MEATVANPKHKVERHTVPCTEIKEVREWINGNGSPGAKVKLALLEDRFKDIQNDIREIKDTMTWMRNVMVGLVITVVASLIIYFVVQVIPHVNGG